MGDLKKRWLICLKGWLFLLCGATAAALLILQAPNLQTVSLLGIAIWCFCRFYYFAFYVVQHYVDDTYRFRGLIDFFRYLIRPRSS